MPWSISSVILYSPFTLHQSLSDRNGWIRHRDSHQFAIALFMFFPPFTKKNHLMRTRPCLKLFHPRKSWARREESARWTSKNIPMTSTNLEISFSLTPAPKKWEFEGVKERKMTGTSLCLKALSFFLCFSRVEKKVFLFFFFSSFVFVDAEKHNRKILASHVLFRYVTRPKYWNKV